MGRPVHVKTNIPTRQTLTPCLARAACLRRSVKSRERVEAGLAGCVVVVAEPQLGATGDMIVCSKFEVQRFLLPSQSKLQLPLELQLSPTSKSWLSSCGAGQSTSSCCLANAAARPTPHPTPPHPRCPVVVPTFVSASPVRGSGRCCPRSRTVQAGDTVVSSQKKSHQATPAMPRTRHATPCSDDTMHVDHSRSKRTTT